ncbi:glycosyltransferase family 4 protein [Methylophaga sp.]|uniref:glycosyltransferase family 4 protein n=1 Tax=Methylophaga sp. TaxID=2024840 RepID=UPI003A91C682
MKVIHLTPHLGGGVGRALSGLLQPSEHHVEHVFVCLEQAEKDHFIKLIIASGYQVIVEPDEQHLKQLIIDADIVQLEWWRHPITISALLKCSHLPMRLVVWCHVSGLYNEIIPNALLEISSRFILTSACSYQAESLHSILELHSEKLAVIHSNNGLENWPRSTACQPQNPLSVGYLGSFNFAKLHPDYISYLAKIELTPFTVTMIGDALNADTLMAQAKSLGRKDLLRFTGYTDDVANSLDDINVLAYLQNPRHYGTNENALLESMAMGIVPVVLDNPAECEIVEHGKTGLVVYDQTSFAQAILWLEQHPQKRTEMGENAAAFVRERHASGKMQRAFDEQYNLTMQTPKQTISFENIFGEMPSQWFLSCQQQAELFKNDGVVESPDDDYLCHSMMEKTKGSAIHFHHYFPQDELLAKWATGVTAIC